MTILELRTTMMKAKKTEPQKAKVFMAILSAAQLIAKEDGNREPMPNDILKAAGKELKMANQSKAAGAPHNELTFEVCQSFLPPMMSADEITIAVQLIVDSLPEKSMKMIGKVMGELSKTYGDALDKGLTSKLVKQAFNA